MSGISALVITRNESSHIEECLRSLGFCDERVVVDSFSDDDTVARAAALADHVYRRDFRTHAEQKNWGMQQLEGEWVLILDADERVPPALAAELQELARGGAQHDGYWIYRTNHFFGRPVIGAGWRRDRVLRFLRAGAGDYPERDLHEEIRLHEGRSAGRCRERLLHYSYEDWPGSFARLRSYSRKGARDLELAGRRASARRLLGAPLLRFLRQYLLQGGFRDGLHGLVLCTWSAFGLFLRWARLRLGETTLPARPGQDGRQRVERVQGRPPREVQTPPGGTA